MFGVFAIVKAAWSDDSLKEGWIEPMRGWPTLLKALRTLGVCVCAVGAF